MTNKNKYHSNLMALFKPGIKKNKIIFQKKRKHNNFNSNDNLKISKRKINKISV